MVPPHDLPGRDSAEQCGHPAPRPEQQDPDAAQREPERVGDFAVRRALGVGEPEQLALARPEPGQRAAHVGAAFGAARHVGVGARLGGGSRVRQRHFPAAAATDGRSPGWWRSGRDSAGSAPRSPRRLPRAETGSSSPGAGRRRTAFRPPFATRRPTAGAPSGRRTHRTRPRPSGTPRHHLAPATRGTRPARARCPVSPPAAFVNDTASLPASRRELCSLQWRLSATRSRGPFEQPEPLRQQERDACRQNEADPQ